MKQYVYEPKRFFVSVTFTGLFCIVICVACIGAFFDLVPLPRGIAAIAGIVATYQVWNTFIALANPQVVTIDDKTIRFSAYGRTDSFALADITTFLVREFSGKRYVRINGGSMFKGRYWLQTACIENGDELEAWLADFEYRVDPHSLKSQARRPYHTRTSDKRPNKQQRDDTIDK